MEERSRGDFRLPGMTQDALIKSSSEAAASLLAPTQHLVPPMLPSLDAYLDAYRSLMSHDVQAMTALGGCAGTGLAGVRPPGLTMPVLPTAAAAAAAAASLVSAPYYGLSPYSVDLARYGLLSPTYVPPFIAPLLYGSSGAAAAAAFGLLPAAVAEPAQSSPGAPRSSAEREAAAPGCPPQQSFSKSLLEACAAARKNDCAPATAAVPGARPKQPDAASSKPARGDPHLIDRAKPTALASPRTVAAPADLLTTNERKWNFSSKVDRTEVPSQSSTAAVVDFSARRTSDVSAKSSVAVSALSADSWKYSSASSTSLNSGNNVTVNSTQSFGERSIVYGVVNSTGRNYRRHRYTDIHRRRDEHVFGKQNHVART